MAERVCYSLHVAALAKRAGSAGSQDRFRQATRHDLLAGTDLPRKFDAGDIQQGRQHGRPPGFSGGPSRHVQLHRLPQQRCGLPENRIESGGRQTEPESVGFHVHAGKGAAVGGPASSTAISWILMVGSTMGTLPKDLHNDRPGATPSEHEGSFSRRAMLAGTVAATATAAVAPISGSAYAAGPDVNSP